jgi:phage terminase large subunit-like protein
MDAFDSALAVLWASEDADDTGIDWGAIGMPMPRHLDAHTREALYLIEPPPPPAWRKIAHPYQIEAAESEASYILMMAGRGSGKTFTAAHTLAEWIEAEPGDYAIVAPTFGDAVQICADGPSGFVKAAGAAIADFNRSNYTIYMTNGSRVRLASADAPDRVRGWNFTGFWADELASWRTDEIWEEGLEFATRIGSARRIITTTPKRGTKGGAKILKNLVREAKEGDEDIHIVRASTTDNAANLSRRFLKKIQRRFAGTMLGRQELDGELLNDVEGALVTTAMMEACRTRAAQAPDFWRVVVAVDPAVSNTARSDEVGIIVAGIGPAPEGWQPPGGRLVLAGAAHVYLLEDCSGRMSVDTWARRALRAAEEWDADCIVAEVNQGGDLVESNIRSTAKAESKRVPRVRQVRASAGKRTRAEPVGGLFEQRRAHVVGTMTELEEQWTEWVPGEDRDSPDRLDASVWAVVGLMPELGIGGKGAVRILSAG